MHLDDKLKVIDTECFFSLLPFVDLFMIIFEKAGIVNIRWDRILLT